MFHNKSVCILTFHSENGAIGLIYSNIKCADIHFMYERANGEATEAQYFLSIDDVLLKVFLLRHIVDRRLYLYLAKSFWIYDCMTFFYF